ncbi:MAG: hypothetical protein J7L66_00425, partial [Anaerolineaceae bacterium]|nr:hypothetical protein [Anaerolineaceae bacterium]
CQMMNPEIVKKVNSKIWMQFPYLQNSNPKIQVMPDNSVILRYSGESKTANGHSLPVTIKVKAAHNGKILQITSSR